MREHDASVGEPVSTRDLIERVLRPELKRWFVLDSPPGIRLPCRLGILDDPETRAVANEIGRGVSINARAAAEKNAAEQAVCGCGDSSGRASSHSSDVNVPSIML